MPDRDVAPLPGVRWGRREVLGLGLRLPLVAAGLTACSVSPVIREPGSGTPGASGRRAAGTPSPEPGPSPTVPAAATAEQQLSAYAAAVLAGPHRSDLDPRTRALLQLLRDAHAEHAVALAGAEPGLRPTSASPSPTAPRPALAGRSLGSALAGLARAESAQAARQRRAAVASTGLVALLSGSLAVAAASYASALAADDPPGVARIGPHKPVPLLSDVAATQAMVSQLHAMVYGYQLAIGKLSVGSAARARAVRGLADQRALLDELVAVLVKRSATVPAAEPAYVPSPDPRNPSGASALIRSMQSRLVPHAGVLLAAAGSASARSRALTILTSTSAAARRWGAPLRAWPGWPD